MNKQKLTPQNKATITVLAVSFVILFPICIESLSSRGMISQETHLTIILVELWISVTTVVGVLIWLIWLILVEFYSEPER